MLRVEKRGKGGIKMYEEPFAPLASSWVVCSILKPSYHMIKAPWPDLFTFRFHAFILFINRAFPAYGIISFFNKTLRTLLLRNPVIQLNKLGKNVIRIYFSYISHFELKLRSAQVWFSGRFLISHIDAFMYVLSISRLKLSSLPRWETEQTKQTLYQIFLPANRI